MLCSLFARTRTSTGHFAFNRLLLFDFLLRYTATFGNIALKLLTSRGLIISLRILLTVEFLPKRVRNQKLLFLALRFLGGLRGLTSLSTRIAILHAEKLTRIAFLLTACTSGFLLVHALGFFTHLTHLIALTIGLQIVTDRLLTRGLPQIVDLAQAILNLLFNRVSLRLRLISLTKQIFTKCLIGCF